MEIKKSPKFKQFVGESKDSFLRRIQYNLKRSSIEKILKEKKDFILSEEEIEAVCRGMRDVHPKIKKMMASSDLSEDDFQDIFQESIIALYNNIGAKIDCTLNTFFYSICYRQTLKHLRSKNKTIIIDLTDPTLDVKPRAGVSSQRINQIIQTIPSGSIFPNQAPTPDNTIELSEMKSLVHKALNEMAGKCRQLLTKYYIDGFSWNELAIQFELENAVTAKMTAKRCRNRFKDKYDGLEIFVNNK